MQVFTKYFFSTYNVFYIDRNQEITLRFAKIECRDSIPINSMHCAAAFCIPPLLLLLLLRPKYINEDLDFRINYILIFEPKMNILNTTK